TIHRCQNQACAVVGRFLFLQLWNTYGTGQLTVVAEGAYLYQYLRTAGISRIAYKLSTDIVEVKLLHGWCAKAGAGCCTQTQNVIDRPVSPLLKVSGITEIFIIITAHSSAHQHTACELIISINKRRDHPAVFIHCGRWRYAWKTLDTAVGILWIQSDATVFEIGIVIEISVFFAGSDLVIVDAILKTRSHRQIAKGIIKIDIKCLQSQFQSIGIG